MVGRARRLPIPLVRSTSMQPYQALRGVAQGVLITMHLHQSRTTPSAE